MITYFQQRQIDLFNAYSTSSKISHSLIIGAERELIAKRFLAEHLPSSMEISKGILIGKNKLNIRKPNKNEKPEIDIIIHKKSGSSLTFFGGTKTFFAENTACVIEVKSKLNRTELNKIKKHCAKIKTIDYRNINGVIDFNNMPINKIPYYVICFESSLKVNDIIDQLKDVSKDDLPNGIFGLNPKNGFSLILANEERGATNIITDPIGFLRIANSPYSGGVSTKDTLLYFWILLLNNVEMIQRLNFPLPAYINIIKTHLFGTATQQ